MNSPGFSKSSGGFDTNCWFAFSDTAARFTLLFFDFGLIFTCFSPTSIESKSTSIPFMPWALGLISSTPGVFRSVKPSSAQQSRAALRSIMFTSSAIRLASSSSKLFNFVLYLVSSSVNTFSTRLLP